MFVCLFFLNTDIEYLWNVTLYISGRGRNRHKEEETLWWWMISMHDKTAKPLDHLCIVLFSQKKLTQCSLFCLTEWLLHHLVAWTNSMCSHGRMIDGNYYCLGFGTFKLTINKTRSIRLTRCKRRKGNHYTWCFVS